MSTLREKVLGCWLGKAVGGTLGQPYEGCDGPLNLDFYCPVPDDMIPNDDLDLQVLWACLMDKMEKLRVCREDMAKAWLNNVEFPWDEYGVAIRNLRDGIKAPFSGSYDNWFKDGLGAAIRSELWACLAPGNPELAAAYAYEDACVDHTGEGIWAEVFLAAMESLAFENSDIPELVRKALKFIPEDCRLKSAIRDSLEWSLGTSEWMEVRNRILKEYGSENFTDVVMNLPFIILGLVRGKGNFSKSICITVNCGRDADCSTATAGAILGIIAPDSIEKRWLEPIGRKLVINPEITGIEPPDSIDSFTDMVLGLKDRLKGKFPPECSNTFDADKFKIKAEAGLVDWFAQDNRLHLNKVPEIKEKTETLTFSGTKGSVKAEKVPGDKIMLMKFKIEMPETKDVHVMFNSNANSRVWIDGEYAFGREGGRMAPSFHRVPVNQQATLTLSAGTHEITAGIAPVKGQSGDLEWVIGVGDAKTNMWLNKVF